MPKIEKLFTLEVTPESFLNACSGDELVELDFLLNSHRYQSKIIKHIETKTKIS